MNVTTDDATTVRTGLQTPTGIDVLDAAVGKRINIGPHVVRPYEDGSRRTCWKCVDCGEYNAEYDLHRFLTEPCRDAPSFDPEDWADDPRPHADGFEERVVELERNDEPWEMMAAIAGPFRRRMQVPASFERVGTDANAVELDLDGGGNVHEWRKRPVYECPDCGERLRGPSFLLSSKSKYPDWARTPVDDDPGRDS